MTRRRWVVLAALAVMCFIATVVVATLRNDDESPSAASTPDLDVSAFTGAARELVALVDHGRDLVHHASYEQSSGDRYEVWVDHARVREEVRPVDGKHRLFVRTERKAVDCVQDGTRWSCSEPVKPSIGVQSRLEQLVADLSGLTVSASDAKVAGLGVRCFDVESPESPVEICMTPEGALARLVVDNEDIALAKLDFEVDGSVFDIPPKPPT
jgi:hypothetical protein